MSQRIFQLSSGLWSMWITSEQEQNVNILEETASIDITENEAWVCNAFWWKEFNQISCREHSALKPRGLASAPKFVENCQNKFLANEEENAYVQLEVYGDPAPTISWFR